MIFIHIPQHFLNYEKHMWIASYTLSFYILWLLRPRFEERGGGNGYEKKLWRRRYEYTFMICCRMYECTHDRGNEYIFYLSSDWWMILWERKKAQIKLENHKIWFVWYDNIMEKGNTNFFGLVCNNNMLYGVRVYNNTHIIKINVKVGLELGNN